MPASTSLIAALAGLATSGSPSPAPSLIDTNQPDCWTVKGSFCHWVYTTTGSSTLSNVANWFLAKPLTILLILLIAVLVRWLLHRVISRLAKQAAEGSVPGVLQHGPAAWLESTPLLSERRRQRAETMASVLRSITTGVVFTIAAVMVLGQLDIVITPLLASAGIAGVALGFGAQSLVKDFLSGIFMILEDQYGVGDVIDSGEASGTVEAVGLRVTRLRDVNGTVWYVPNGQINRVGNMSQGWARAVIDVGVGYGEDIAAVRDLLGATANEMYADPAWTELILEPPEVWGVQDLGADSVVVRVVVKTAPLQQWSISRELRQRIKAALDAAGVEIPFPQRTVWIRTPGAPESAAAQADADGTD